VLPGLFAKSNFRNGGANLRVYLDSPQGITTISEIHFGNHSNSSISHESVFSSHGDCIHSISVKFAILKGLKSLSPALRGTSYAGCPVAEIPNPERVESQSIQTARTKPAPF